MIQPMRIRFRLGGVALILILANCGGGCARISAQNLCVEGAALILQKRYAEAIPYFDRAIEASPDFTRAYFQRGQLHHLEGEYRKAVKDFSKVLSVEPQNGEALAERAQSYEQLAEHQQAVDDLTRALSVKARDRAMIYQTRANAYRKLGMNQEALDDFTKVINLSPRSGKAYIERAQTLEALGQYQKAIADCDQAAKIDPTLSGIDEIRQAAIDKLWPDSPAHLQ